jgi:O-antigen ligase
MNRIEKITIAALVFALSVSFILFGVWEDKALIFAPLSVLIYLTGAVWVMGGMWPVARDAGPNSNFKFQISSLQTPPGGMALLVFWLYSLSRIPFAALPYEAKWSALSFGVYLIIYWASANLLTRFTFRKTVWTALFSLLILTALYSLVQHRAAPNLIFGMERYTDYWKGGRLGGTYQCPNHIAHLFQMGLPFCLVFLFLPQFGWFWRICFAYALPLFLLLIYQTQSRAGILGSMAALGATALFMIWRKSRRAFYIALMAAPLLGAAALGGLWTGSSMFRERMRPVVKFIAHVTSGAVIETEFNDFRPQTWLDTIDMIKHRPVFGFGPGNYALTYEDYRTRCQALRMETVHAHNEYLELPAEYGLMGGLLILWALISISAAMLRFIRTSTRPHHALPAAALLGALAGTAVHGFFDFELHIFANAMMLALLAGCAAAPLMQASPENHPKRNRAIRFLFILPVLLAAFWSVQVMSSAWIRAYGDRLLAAQNVQRAETLYKTAVRIDPQNWLAYWGLGQVYYHYRYYELDPVLKHRRALNERSAYADAYRINTKKEEVGYGLGRVELFLGNQDRGLDLLRQAAKYKRFNDFYWRKLGIELRKAGLYQEALSAFEYAQQLDRTNKTVNHNVKWIRQHMKENQ